MPEFEMQESSGEFEDIPDDTWVDATVVSAVIQEREGKDGKYKKCVFKFAVEDDGTWHGKYVWGETSVAFVDHPDCRLRNWAMEMLGVDQIPVGYKFNTDDVVDCTVKVLVGLREYEKTMGGKTETRTTNFVRDVMRSEAYIGTPSAAETF